MRRETTFVFVKLIQLSCYIYRFLMEWVEHLI